MTFRLSLILGLAVALPSAVLPAARGADSTQAAASASSGTAIISDVSSWKRSDRAISADIRFKKPDGIVFTDQPEEPKQEAVTIASGSKSATAPLAAAAPSQAPFATPTAIPAQSPAATATFPIAPITIAPVTRVLAPLATTPATPNPAAPAAATPTLISATPATTILPSLLQQPVNAVAQPAAATAQPSSASTLHTDDQIKLVAQLLVDQGVIRAAQEEPLPGAPNSGAANGQANNGRNGNSMNNPIGPDSGEPCYDDCNCCPPPPCLFWVGGVEATFLAPDLNRAGASLAVEQIEDERFDLCSTATNDLDSLYISPRIWLGVQGCCWGANLRYWDLNANDASHDPSLGKAGTWDDFDCVRPDLGYFSYNQLDAYTVDFEITRRFCIHDCWMQAGIGVRHAELWHDQGITGIGLTDEGLLNGFARANRNSRGTGLLFSLYGRKPLFPCSCINWFYNARWSALWGPTQTSAETFAAAMANDPDFVASAASINSAYSNIDDTLFIGEIQLGLEWNYALACLPANAFFRTAIEYQRWDGGDGFSESNSFAGVSIDDGEPATSLVDTNAFADAPQMDLLGFTIGTGLTW